MKIVFCEECGGRNSVTPEQIKNSEATPPVCRFCGNVMSSETIISYEGVAATSGAIDTTKYHILVIDDDTFYLEMAKTVLGRDYKISIASSGEEGLALALSRQPDLILLDVQMPRVDGYETCRELKRNSKTRGIPVFFVSAKTEGDDEYKGLSLGAVDYICKPLQLDVLNARINLQLRLQVLLAQEKEKQADLKKTLLEFTLRAEKEQEQLVQEKNDFQAVVNRMGEMVTLGDKQMRITWANQAVLDTLKTSLANIVGRHCYEVFANNTTLCPQCPLGADGTADFSQIVTCQRQGEEGPPLEQVHIPLLNDEGFPTGIAHVVKEKTAWLV